MKLTKIIKGLRLIRMVKLLRLLKITKYVRSRPDERSNLCAVSATPSAHVDAL